MTQSYRNFTKKAFYAFLGLISVNTKDQLNVDYTHISIELTYPIIIKLRAELYRKFYNHDVIEEIRFYEFIVVEKANIYQRPLCFSSFHGLSTFCRYSFVNQNSAR